MKNKIFDLSERLCSVPHKIQLAISAKWENAWILDPAKDNYNREQIVDFVNVDNSETAAVEIFYKDTVGQDVYFGIRYSDALVKVNGVVDFIEKILYLVMKKRKNFEELVSELGVVLNDNPQTFLNSKPNKAVLGVVDYWLTYGPCEIWKSGYKFVSKDILDTIISKNNDLVINKDNYVGLEFVYGGVATYWLSFQVSNKEDSAYVLDKPKVLKIIGYWL